MNQDQTPAGLAAGTSTNETNQAYTYADLLATLQTLTPEQLQQKVWGWDENQCYNQISARVLEEDYVLDDTNYGPESTYQEYATPEELEDIATWSRLPKGTVVLDIGE